MRWSGFLQGWSLGASVFVAALAGQAQSKTTKGSVILVQQDKRRAKSAPKKKKTTEDEQAFGPDDLPSVDTSDNGVGVHREQAGVDKPYFHEISGTTNLAFLTVKTGDGAPQQATQIDIKGAFLIILGHVEIGPELSFMSSTTDATVSTTDPVSNKVTSSTSETKTQSLAAGPLVKINFGKIDRGTTVPFADVGADYAATTHKVGSAAEASSSGYVLHAGGGLNMFLSDHVAFQPKLEYRMATDKGSGANAVATTTSGFGVLIGIGTFL